MNEENAQDIASNSILQMAIQISDDEMADCDGETNEDEDMPDEKSSTTVREALSNPEYFDFSTLSPDLLAPSFNLKYLTIRLPAGR